MSIPTTTAPADDYDAHETAKPYEPTFTVQGGDPLGPPTVMFWADSARNAARRETDEAKALKLFAKAKTAEEVAWAMQSYQRGDTEQVERRALYNDDANSLSQVAKVDQRRAMITATNQLQNALAIGNDAALRLAEMQVEPEAEVMIREAVELLRQAAGRIDPRRNNERS